MKVKRLKELLNKVDDNQEVFIANSMNICGNISELDQIEETTYGFFGSDVPCIILTSENAKNVKESYTVEELLDCVKGEL